MKKILYLIISILLLSISTGKIFAKAIDFKIFPAIIEIETEPGQIIQHQIVVKGSGNEEYRLKVYGLEITDNLGHFKSSREYVPQLDWVTFEPESFVFKENEEIRVKLNLNIPQEVKLGDYYLSIALERLPEEDLTNTITTGSIQIPLLITVTQDGYPPIEGEIKEFRTKYLDLFNPITFQLEVENPGFRKLKSYGKMEITNLITNEVYTKELIPQNVLVDSSRIVIDEEGFVEGKDYISWISPQMFGIYSARVDIYDRYYQEDGSNILVSSPELTYVYFNFFLLIGIILSITLIVVFILQKKHENDDLHE